ncbi:MAG TPA: DUF6011 domain-containing protein [Cellulomonas sp.]|uniref:DUF6011 domain-containing protein n=1 Tax=Cellulomonas sp. TaxID=40001 RepID=UPI002E310415|nr:DUF6011 domain-containing protein [Cellulomonas sp.]HEX5332833.1 DUF6011 domain-containing protein [Cellulomonas sp.]
MTALENVPELVDAGGVSDVDAEPAAPDSAPIESAAVCVRPLDPGRYLDGRVEEVLPALLLDSAAPLSVDELARGWCAADEVVDQSVPLEAVREVIKAWSRRFAVVLDDGRIGLVARGTLPPPNPWTDKGMPFAVDTEPLSPGVSRWPGDWGHLIGAVAAAVRPARFRSMHIEATDRFGGACEIDVAVVDLGQAIATLTTSRLVCSRRTVASLERGQWWFWDATTTPLLDAETRLYGAEIVEGRVTRCVNAATTTRGTGEAVALLLLAANLDKDLTLTVSIEQGPETLGARSAEEWARTAPDAGTVRCVECGRPLTDAESASRGFGPGCWERLGPEDQAELERLVLPLRWRGGAIWAYPLSVAAWGDVVSRAPDLAAPASSVERRW